MPDENESEAAAQQHEEHCSEDILPQPRMSPHFHMSLAEEVMDDDGAPPRIENFN